MKSELEQFLLRNVNFDESPRESVQRLFYFLGSFLVFIVRNNFFRESKTPVFLRTLQETQEKQTNALP